MAEMKRFYQPWSIRDRKSLPYFKLLETLVQPLLVPSDDAHMGTAFCEQNGQSTTCTSRAPRHEAMLQRSST